MSATDVERMLVAWFETAEAAREPADLLPRVFAVTRQTSQRRRAVGRLYAVVADIRAMPRLRMSPVVAVALLTVLMLAVLVGGAIIGGRLQVSSQPGWRVLDRSDPPGAYTWVSDVTKGGPGVVAVGVTASPTDSECGRATHGHVWTSTDGNGWTDVGGDVFADVRLEKVVRSGEMLYAVGSVDASCGQAGQEGQGPIAIWRSSDGVAWERMSTGPPLEGSSVDSLVEIDGVLLATGAHQEADPPVGSGIAQTRVWTLSSGEWERVASLDGVVVARLAATGKVVVAVGYDLARQESKLWYSDDVGRTWLTADVVPVDRAELVAVTASGGTFVAVGTRQTGDHQPSALALRSTDGRTWSIGQPPENPTALALQQVWAGTNGFIAAGSGAGVERPAECIASIARPSVVPTPAGTPVATSEVPSVASRVPEEDGSTGSQPPGCSRLFFQAETWLSQDAITWQLGPDLPEAGEDLPSITEPIPAPGYSLASSNGGVVVSNPTFGAALWFAPAGDFAPKPQVP